MVKVKKSTADAGGGCIAALIVGVINWLAGAWYLMLFVGDVHLDWWRKVPLLSWDSSLWLGLLLASFVSTASYRATRSKS